MHARVTECTILSRSHTASRDLNSVRITQQTLLLPGFTTVCMLAIITERLHYFMAGKTEAETNQETHWNHATPKRQGLNEGPLGLELLATVLLKSHRQQQQLHQEAQ